MSTIRRGLELLATRADFRNLMGAQFLAQAGDGVVQTALAKFVAFGNQRGFDLEGARSPEELLTIALWLFVPYTVISPFLGVVIDRWDRRRLLFAANGLRAVVVGVIAAVIAWAGPQAVPEALLLAAFLLTMSATRVVLATKAAAIPVTLGGGSLVEANAVSQLGGALFQLGGGGAAFVAAVLLPVGPIALAGAVVYAAGAGFALALRRAGEARARSTFAAEVPAVVRRIADGVREVARAPKAGAAITTYFWLRLLWSFSFAAIGFIARTLLGDDQLLVIVVTGGAGAAGAVLGFVLASRLTERVRPTAALVLSASLTVGVATAALGAMASGAVLAALAFFLGFGFFVAKISLDTMVQEALGDGFRGRAFALYDIAYNLAWVLAAFSLWAATPQLAFSTLIALMGVVFLAGTAALGAWYRGAGLLATPARHGAAA